MASTKLADRQLLTPPSGGGFILTEVELDFGTTPIKNKNFEKKRWRVAVV